MRTLEVTAEVAVPIRTAYDQWTRFESFPRFMSTVREVEQVRPAVTRWLIGLGPVTREFHAEILEQEPDSHISWRSWDRRLRHAGTVSFTPVDPQRTLVTIAVRCATWTGPGVVTLPLVRRTLAAELEHFRVFIEGVGDAGETWRGTIHDGRLKHLKNQPPTVPGWQHG
ncbi:SRPBCC family protein [Nocardioides sp. CFH 31398]|uniref:SRPBCC family protein n=1 Tax=Nocardioides sp. CFH 31398 TaxID=2919579 RepID=UPI001F066690|nr:SRPBCC family protein [Nocardioides sp. CFH 31398]MCH1866998.1 SRPBCC family protein [Nocardioides sp. CFH 31398]